VGGIPYCAAHQARGDDALAVRTAASCGRILVAARPLPRGYRLAYWGVRRAWRACAAKSSQRRDYALVLAPNAGVIDPVGLPGALLQFCSCPGPGERRNVVRWTRVFGGRATKGLVAREYRTSEAVPQGTQLLIFYGNDWFEARGITRQKAGTARYPAPLRRGAKQAAAAAEDAPSAAEEEAAEAEDTQLARGRTRWRSGGAA
jgi:hypothetical protein